ncbi:hypothetical protein DdX_11161 [Ditylenchus destructor]|uniref:F-box domain-containing protein n=1 Tax=Ditylenchus destructor TaxID=166010 RepID=A0AAD4MZI1_9BILA|nr:hypothetical protein DdX_11161 [Ditylenchus destructor]
MNVFSRPIQFGIAYSILQMFNRRELYNLSLICRYFSAIIDQKLATRPYLLLDELQREQGKWLIRYTNIGSFTPASQSDRNYEMLQECKFVRFDNVSFGFRSYDHPSSMNALLPISHRHTKGYAMQNIPVTDIVDFLTKPCNGTDPVDLFISASFLPTLEQRDEIIERIKQKFEDATSKLVIELTWTTVEFLPTEIGETVPNYNTKTKLEITNNDQGLYIKTYDL